MSRRGRAWFRPAMADGGRDSSRDLGQERHRILRELRQEILRHPAVTDVMGVPDGQFRELRAELDSAAFDRDAETASLRVAWWPTPDDPSFVFHYSESSGFDCGWHREENPHVDGKIHYQERAAPDASYEYEAISLPTLTPTRLCWTVLDRLAVRLE